MVTRFLKRLVNPMANIPPAPAPPPADTTLSRWKTRLATSLGRYESKMTIPQKKIALGIFLSAGFSFFTFLLLHTLNAPDKTGSPPNPTGSFSIPPVAKDSTSIGEVWSRINQYSDTLQNKKNNGNTIYPK